MALPAERGARVTTRDFGSGTVVRATRTGAVVELDQNGLQIEVAASDYQIDVPAAPQPATSPAAVIEPPPASALARDELDARRTIEALRFGLVPRRGLERLTLGFEELRRWTVEQLPHSQDSGPTISEIVGPFGTGKSHTMAVIRLVAERQGYLTTRVEVDGVNVGLADPERLLYALWHSMRGEGLESATPLLDVYLKAIAEGHAAPSIAPNGVDRVRHNYETVRAVQRAGRVDELGHVLDALLSSSPEFTANQVRRLMMSHANIYGLDVNPKKMIGRNVVDRPYDFVEAIAGHTRVSTLAGYRGLIITIDEFEVEHNLRTRFDRVEELLSVLTQYLAGKLEHPAVPVAFFFATTGEDGHVGDRVVDAMIKVAGGCYRVLDGRTREERRELAERIFELYAEAFGVAPHEFDEQLVDTVERRVSGSVGDDSGLIRAFIKCYVSLLDTSYGPGCQ